MAYADSSHRGTEPLAVALGWFSIALGVAELAAPSRMARLIGARDTDTTRNTLRAFGAREIATGVAILAQPGQARWLWSRVGRRRARSRMARPQPAVERHRPITGAARHGRCGSGRCERAGHDDGATAQSLRTCSRSRSRSRAVKVEQVVTINRSIDEVYGFWRHFANFPQFMRHLKKVEMLDNRRSRWTAKAPAGMSVQWDAEIVQDQDGEWLAWRSLPGSQVENSGSVRFAAAPGARGTEVRVADGVHAAGGRASDV